MTMESGLCLSSRKHHSTHHSSLSLYHSLHNISIQSSNNNTDHTLFTVLFLPYFFPHHKYTFSSLPSLHCNLHYIPMASPCSRRIKAYLLHGIQVSITVAFVFSLTVLLLPTKSGGSGLFHSTERDVEDRESKKVIGSKPPSCLNKCMKCRPCLATLVAPDHRRKKNKGFKVWSRGEDDDPYYLLSWKCACGDKLFQP